MLEHSSPFPKKIDVTIDEQDQEDQNTKRIMLWRERGMTGNETALIKESFGME